MRFLREGLLIASAGLCFAGIAFAQGKAVSGDVLLLKDALRMTYLENPSLRAARAELAAVEEQLPQALGGYRPSISATGSIIYGDTKTKGAGTFGDGDTTAKTTGLSLSQPLYKGGSTQAQVGIAKAVINAQKQFLRAIEQDIMLDAATAYLDVVRDQALLQLSENNKNVIIRQLEATQDRFDVGELTLTDVSQAKARLARANSDVIAARGQLNASRAVFEQLIGRSAPRLVRPHLKLPVPDTIDEAAIRAQNSSPAVRSSEFAHDVAKNDVDNIFGDLLPDVDLVASYSKSYEPSPSVNEQETNQVGVTATVPLYQAGVNRSRLRAAKHTANQRYIQVLETKRLARQQAVSAWERLVATRAEIKSRQSQVEASEVAREGVHEEANSGTRTVLDSLDADQELLDAQVALVTTLRNELVAQFTLLSVLGDLSPQTLGFATEIAARDDLF